MKTSTETLSIEIQTAIQLIITATRDATIAAVEEAFRGLGGPSSNRTTSVDRPARRREPGAQRRSDCQRRSPTEISALADRLFASLKDKPGTTMVELAQSVGTKPSELTVPMAQLKRDGRIKAVGKRQFMRYYPRVESQSDATPIQEAA